MHGLRRNIHGIGRSIRIGHFGRDGVAHDDAPEEAEEANQRPLYLIRSQVVERSAHVQITDDRSSRLQPAFKQLVAEFPWRRPLPFSAASRSSLPATDRATTNIAPAVVEFEPPARRCTTASNLPRCQTRLDSAPHQPFHPFSSRIATAD